MMVTNNNTASTSHHHQDRDYKKKMNSGSTSSSRNYKCELCDRFFTSGCALGGHMTSHSRIQQKGLNGIQNSVSLSEQQSQSIIDLSKYLPPMSHHTKKRRNRRNDVVDDDLEAAHILLQMSQGGRVYHENEDTSTWFPNCNKRLKLSGNDDDDHTQIKKQDVMLMPTTQVNKLVLKFKIPKQQQHCILHTPDVASACDHHQHIQDKNDNINEGEKQNDQQLGVSRVVRDFDLNELPTDDGDDVGMGETT